MAFALKVGEDVAIIDSFKHNDQETFVLLQQISKKYPHPSLNWLLKELQKEKINQVRTLVAPRFTVIVEKENIQIYDRYTEDFVEKLM